MKKTNIFVSCQYDTLYDQPKILSLGLYSETKSFYAEFYDYNIIGADKHLMSQYFISRKFIDKDIGYSEYDKNLNLKSVKGFTDNYIVNNIDNHLPKSGIREHFIKYFEKFEEFNLIYDFNPYDITTGYLDLMGGVLSLADHPVHFHSLSSLANQLKIKYNPITEFTKEYENKFEEKFFGTSIEKAYFLYLAYNKIIDSVRNQG